MHCAGTCRIKVSVVGVNSDQTVLLRPNVIRGMTGWIIDECVTRSGGIGGVITAPVEGTTTISIASIAAGHMNGEFILPTSIMIYC